MEARGSLAWIIINTLQHICKITSECGGQITPNTYSRPYEDVKGHRAGRRAEKIGEG